MPNPFRETEFLDANRDRETLTFPVQLITSRISDLTRLIHTLTICDYTIKHAYTAAAELGRNPVNKHQIQPEYGDERTKGRVLYAPVQKRHNTGKSEAVVVYNTDQSLGSLGCF